jgi:Tfp pilus assembly protein PilX
MKTLSRLLMLAMLAGIFSVPMAMATAQDKDQPRMEAALAALREAEKQLQEAKPDKGGHRVAALKAVHEAIRQTELGIKAGEKHEDHHDHDHDHDKK